MFLGHSENIYEIFLFSLKRIVLSRSQTKGPIFKLTKIFNFNPKD